MLQLGFAGKLAEGGPHCEMSMEEVDVAPVTEAGMSGRYCAT